MESLEVVLKEGIVTLLLTGLTLACSSCSSHGVKVRVGSLPYPGPTTNFPNPSNLGVHNSSEKKGEVYTCEAGLIDIVHVRKSADYTKVFSEKIFDNLMKGKEKFSLQMPEPSNYFIELNYPENWKALSLEEKKRIANEISIKLGAHISYMGTTWHEILTWFDYKSTGLISEFGSAFSLEDGFSNLLGTYLAEKVLTENKGDYNTSLTRALDEEIRSLGVQPRKIARKSTRDTKRKRNLDIGLDDGYVTPWIIPVDSVPESMSAKPKAYPVPNTDILSKYGFSMKFEIEPHELFEKGKILNIAGQRKRINPTQDFPKIMNYIKKQAVEKYKFDINVPSGE